MPDKSPLILTFTGAQLMRSIWVMLIVGTILNVINQGDALVAGTQLNWPKLLLTFAVPFCVASYGAWSALRDVSTRA